MAGPPGVHDLRLILGSLGRAAGPARPEPWKSSSPVGDSSRATLAGRGRNGPGQGRGVPPRESGAAIAGDRSPTDSSLRVPAGAVKRPRFGTPPYGIRHDLVADRMPPNGSIGRALQIGRTTWGPARTAWAQG